MILNHLYVVPDTDTVSYLEQVFQGSPFHVDFNSLRLTIFISMDPIEPESDATYIAYPGTMGYWYEGKLQASSLILPLFSDQLQAEYKKLSNNIRPAYGLPYIPAVTLVPFAPPKRAVIANFVNSISEALVHDNQPLIFVNETVIGEDFEGPPNFEFIRDMVDRIERGLR